MLSNRLSRALARISFIITCFLNGGAHAESLGRVAPHDDYIVTGSITNNDVPAGDLQRGKVPEFGHCYHFKKLQFNALDWIETDLFDAKWTDNDLMVWERKVDKMQWIEIDACARTMMAEMGMESACNDDYDVALARIIANRTSLMRRKATKKSFDLTEYLSPTKNAVEEKYQFSVWNDGAKVNEGAPCPLPPRPPARSQREQALFQKVQDKFQEYVNLCKTAVVDDGRMIKMRTSDQGGMTDHMYFYTSGCRMHYQRLCEGYSAQRPTVGQTTISDYRCFEMWNQPKYTLENDQEAKCKDVATSCCVQKTDRLKPDANDNVCAIKAIALGKILEAEAATRATARAAAKKVKSGLKKLDNSL